MKWLVLWEENMKYLPSDDGKIRFDLEKTAIMLTKKIMDKRNVNMTTVPQRLKVYPRNEADVVFVFADGDVYPVVFAWNINYTKCRVDFYDDYNEYVKFGYEVPNCVKDYVSDNGNENS